MRNGIAAAVALADHYEVMIGELELALGAVPHEFHGERLAWALRRWRQSRNGSATCAWIRSGDASRRPTR